MDIVGQADKAYQEMMALEPQARDNISTAHRNFLRWAVYYLYVYGQANQANRWWNELREKYPAVVPPNQTLEDYALDRAQETVSETSHDDAKAVIIGCLREAFWNMAIGEESRAVNYLRFAEKLRARFQDAVGPVSVNRVGLPDMAEMKRVVLEQMLDPENGLDPVLAAQLRTSLGLPAGATGVDLKKAAVPGATTTNAPSAAPQQP
ncbi:MAG: hypothetical protein U1G07_16260 [Verrucomicrobiota bacterium]